MSPNGSCKVKYIFPWLAKTEYQVDNTLIYYFYAVRTLLDLVEPIVTADTVWMFQWEVYKAVFGYCQQQGTTALQILFHKLLTEYLTILALGIDAVQIYARISEMTECSKGSMCRQTFF